MVYYSDTSKDNFVKYNGSGSAHCIIMNDDSSNDLEFSLDGSSVKGVIKANEGIDFRNVNFDSIYIRSRTTGNSAPFRLWLFGNRDEVTPNPVKDTNQVAVPKTFIKLDY